MTFVRSPVTERLRSEPLTQALFEDVSLLHRDPAVMKTLSPDGNPLPDDVTRRGVEDAVAHWQRYGFGLWAFYDKADRRFVGRAGLKIYSNDDRDQVGLAYAVVSGLWGRGFATEMAEASLEVGFGELELPEVGCWTLPINASSQRVMEKLGFVYERNFQFAGLEHRYYRLQHTQWRLARKQ